MAAIISMTRVLARLQNTKHLILQWLFKNNPPGMYGMLAYDLAPVAGDSCPSTSNHRSVLDSIFDPTMWAVPKSRRSLEKRLTRKHGAIKHFEAAIPKKNIVACLDCGHWHERETICGNCYKKVQQETKELKAAMGDDFLYNIPRKEITIVYEGEETKTHEHAGKYVIEMKKPRPQWFPKHLMIPVKEDS